MCIPFICTNPQQSNDGDCGNIYDIFGLVLISLILDPRKEQTNKKTR